MAGSYPDAPARKIAYDVDGSSGFRILNGALSQLTAGDLATLNDERDTGIGQGGYSNVYTGVVFPHKWNIVGMYHAGYGNDGFGNSGVTWSADTTNGQDGTWTAVSVAAGATGSPGYRNDVRTINLTGVKGIRCYTTTVYSAGGTFYGMNLYGTPTAGENPNRLELWHPTTDVVIPAAQLDFGDHPRGASVDKGFRVKNLSATLTASTITASLTTLQDSAAPTVLSQMTLNYNGGAFAASPVSGPASLAPGIISPVFNLRLAALGTAQLGLRRQRLIVAAASWA